MKTHSFTTGFNIIVNHCGKLSVASGIQNKVLENYSVADWLHKIVVFFSALARGKSVCAYLQGMADNDLQKFIQCIGAVRKALCENDRSISLDLPDGSVIEMEFYSLVADASEVLVDQIGSEAAQLMWVKHGPHSDWRTGSFSKEKLLELIDAEIAEHAATYKTEPDLVAACKVEYWYRKSTQQFSEFTSKGELKEPDAVFDHLLNPANTGFHANIVEILQSLIESGAYTGKTSQYLVNLQARHQARLEDAVTIFITEQIDVLVYQGVTEQNRQAVSTALKLISDNHPVIDGINRELTTKIKLLQSYFGKKNLAELPIEIKQKPVSTAIVDQVAQEGLTDKNSNAFITVQTLLLRPVIEKVFHEGLTENNRNEFQRTRESIDSLPHNPDTARLKTMLAECLDKLAATRPPAPLKQCHPQ